MSNLQRKQRMLNSTDVLSSIPRFFSSLTNSQRSDPLIITVNDSRLLSAVNDFVITDPDSEPEDLSLLISEGTNYTVSGQGLNTITPTANYTGRLEVIVRPSDGKAIGPPFTLKIDVRLPSADPLITGQNLLIVDEDSPFTLQFEDLLVTDADDPDYPVGFTMKLSAGVI